MLDAKKEAIKKLSGDVTAVREQFRQYRSWTRSVDTVFLLVAVAMTLSLVTLPMAYGVIVLGGCIIVLVVVFRVWRVRQRKMSDAVQAVEARVKEAELTPQPES